MEAITSPAEVGEPTEIRYAYDEKLGTWVTVASKIGDGETTSAGKPSAQSSEEPKSEKATSGDIVAVTAGEIIKDYSDNELRADMKYKGKLIEVTGTVRKIDTELFDGEKYVLLMNTSVWDFMHVSCYDIDVNDLVELNKGDEVRVRGDLGDGGDLGVTLRNCRIVP
jgi:hypothetical protein